MEHKINDYNVALMNQTLMIGIRNYLRARVDSYRFYYSGVITACLMIYSDLDLFVFDDYDFNFRDAFRGD